MKIILLLLVLVASVIAQGILGYLPPYRFSGDSFTETWNDQNPGGLCWEGGPSGCRNLWKATGSAHSIVASPGSVAIGANSLKMELTGSTTGYVTSFGTSSKITAGSSISDEYIVFKITAHTIANFASKVMYCIGPNESCGSYIARITMSPTSGNMQLIGAGSTTSSRTATVTLNDWHTVRLHIDSTLANCSISLDGATPLTFTCNNVSPSYRTIGDNIGSANTATVYVAGVSASGTAKGGFPYSSLINFESGAHNDAASTTNLAAGTLSGNGAWAIPGPAGLYISTDGQMNLEAAKTISGQQFSDSGSRGLFVDASAGSGGNNPRATYTFVTPYSSVSAWLRFKTDVSNETAYSIANLGAAGADILALHYKPANSGCVSAGSPYACCTGSGTGCDTTGHAYMWVGKDPALGNGGDTLIGPLSTSTNYCVRMLYARGQTHKLFVYESNCSTLIGSVEYAAASTAQCTASQTPFICCTGAGTGCATPSALLPNTLYIGRPGGESGYTDPGGWWIDNILLDYVQAR